MLVVKRNEKKAGNLSGRDVNSRQKPLDCVTRL